MLLLSTWTSVELANWQLIRIEGCQVRYDDCVDAILKIYCRNSCQEIIVAKLNQIIAVEKGVKSAVTRDVTDAYHLLQKAALLTGISRTYTPRDDEGDKLPSEFTKVQVSALEVVKQATTRLSELFDITAVKDWTNQAAVAEIVVDGKTLVKAAPVTYLLFLEKQLTDFHTIVKKLPLLDGSEDWHMDEAQGCYATEPVQTTRTKKIPRNHVKAEATEKHPAQVEVYYEDVIVGTWRTVKLSGALPASTVAALLTRIEKLQAAVKFARETANETETVEKKVGESIFSYLLG